MQEIITGYTGTRHITPAMDAAVWRSIFGPDSYILDVGNKCVGSMPNINTFVIADGVIDMQGHMGYGTQTSLTIDTCATGYKRIDLVVCRYTHDNSTLIDAMEYRVIKGAEVQSPNTPVAPSYNTGIIDQGATIVDMPLYQVSLNGSSVSFTTKAKTLAGVGGGGVLVLTSSSFSSLPQTITDDRITSKHVVIESVLGTPSAQTSDWTVTTTDGSLTIAGTIASGSSTTITLTLAEKLD